MQIRIGCDPELFLVNPSNGSFVSGHDALPGSKADPYKVDRGAVQIDGTALEFNTDPANSCEEFISNIKAVMGQMQAMVEAGPYQHLKIAAHPVAEYDPEYFKSIPGSALMLGCNPDYNAWTLDANPAPDTVGTMRTGSGHIHIGWGEGFDADSADHFMDCVPIIRQLDYYIGLATLIWDPDDRRRKMYGAAGAFRPKPYGAEYRVPSNSWLNSETTQRFVYNAAIKAVSDLIDGDDKSAQFGDKAQQIINNNEIDWLDRYDFGTGLDYKQLRAA